MSEWWEKRGETSKAFESVRDTVPGGNPAFSSHSDEQLEELRAHLEQQRAEPSSQQHLRFGGATEQETHKRVAEESERWLREVEAEQTHRLMLEIDRQDARERDNEQER